MKNKYTKILTILGLILTTNAMAQKDEGGLFIEPMVTYEIGEADLNLPSPFGSSKSDIDGFGLGLRLGLHVYKSVFLGVDGRYSKPTYKNTDTGVDERADAYNYGPVIGFQMPTPFGIRIWAGYIVDGEIDVDRVGTVDFTFEDAKGYRVGAGIKFALVSLNLEYQDIEYTQAQLSGAGVFNGTSNNVVQTNESVVFSVSFPLSL